VLNSERERLTRRRGPERKVRQWRLRLNASTQYYHRRAWTPANAVSAKERLWLWEWSNEWTASNRTGKTEAEKGV
jgi:hypothetical protein